MISGNNDKFFDMLVIGAGPAGCAAATRAAMKGLHVGLIERASFPRNLPGESLHPEISSLLDELGIKKKVAAAGFVRNPGWILEHDGVKTYIPYGEPQELQFGYQAWRADLDTILLEHAETCGVFVLPETDARDVILCDGRVTGIKTKGADLMATHLVDASGPRCWLSQKLSLQPELLSPKLVARYGYSENDFGQGDIPRLLAHASGWTWLAKVQNNTWQCVQLSLLPGKEAPAPPKDMGFPAKLRGADVTWRLVRESAGPGYFICGDAAAVLDPGASRGVARALQSGIKAANYASEAYHGRCSEKDALISYRRWLASSFTAEAQQLAQRYAHWEQPPNWIKQFEGKFLASTLD
ncbi:MAG: tryptophan 7-halogenase [Halioglobus sp.]